MTALVCFAVKQEADFFRPAQVAPHRARICITGMGRDNTENALQSALDEGRPDLVLTCGFAGALNPSLKSGSIVFDADEQSGLEPILTTLKAIPARFHCAGRIASTAAEKQKLFSQTDADAVEMESSHIRQISRGQGIASATIRVILDGADEDLPLDFNRLMNRRYRIDYARLIGRVLASPDKILPLIAFQRQTLMAARKLGSVLEMFLQRLPDVSEGGTPSAKREI